MDPLFNSGWVTFNELHWGLRAEWIELEPRGSSKWRLRVLLYRDRSGSVVMPPRNPYLPVSFECSATRPYTRNHRKRDAIDAFAKLICARRVRGALAFSPIVDDVRPFQWCGFQAEPRYTYFVDLRNFSEDADPSVHNKIRKAQKNGYTCEITTDFDAVQGCLAEAEVRKIFDHKVDAHGLMDLHRLMGADAFLAILCRSVNGEPVGARLQMFCAGGVAYDWSAGVKTDALRNGVNNLLCDFSFKTLAQRGCISFDFCGADIPSVAAAKEGWGGRLVTYYRVRRRSLRSVLHEGYVWVKRAW